MAGDDPIRVLVVDDSEDARFLVRVLLEDEADIEVVAAAADAAAALDALAAGAPDVALVDARMPLVDGFALTRSLVAAAPQLRVVLLSSLVDEVVTEQALAAGAVGAESKGDLDRLAGAVRAAVAG